MIFLRQCSQKPILGGIPTLSVFTHFSHELVFFRDSTPKEKTIPTLEDSAPQGEIIAQSSYGGTVFSRLSGAFVLALIACLLLNKPQKLLNANEGCATKYEKW